MRHIKLVTLLFCIPLFISSCGGIKATGTSKAKKLFETFFAGDEGTQYFVKPFTFKSTSGDELEMDFTFRYKDEVIGNSNINFTIVSKDVIKKVDQVTISSGNASLRFFDLNLMYNETSKKGFVNRFEAKTPLKDLHQVFKNNNWEIKVKDSKGERLFTPSSKASKKITLIDQNIFVLF